MTVSDAPLAARAKDDGRFSTEVGPRKRNISRPELVAIKVKNLFLLGGQSRSRRASAV